MRRSLVVKCGAGVDDPERCSEAFTVAATALSAGPASFVDEVLRDDAQALVY